MEKINAIYVMDNVIDARIMVYVLIVIQHLKSIILYVRLVHKIALNVSIPSVLHAYQVIF
jgi:hypothetical protein